MAMAEAQPSIEKIRSSIPKATPRTRFSLSRRKAQGHSRFGPGQGGCRGYTGPDEFFGEACMAGQLLRLGTVSALTEAVVERFAKSTMIRLIQDEPAFSRMFMTHILNRTIRVEADLIDQLFNSSERRLARLLLLLANYGKEGKLEPIIANMSQETLAEMIGTTRSRVSFFMNRFRKLGFISYNGHIEFTSHC
jgi:CRP-like cAMP-binding protein